jgi:calcium permeable stress-gated cation channel
MLEYQRSLFSRVTTTAVIHCNICATITKLIYKFGLCAMGKEMDPASSSVTTTLWLQGAIGLVCLLIFEVLRKQKEIYAPKLRSRKDRCPPAPDMSLFGWIKSTVAISDEDTLAYVGLDAYVFLRFLKLCFRTFLGCGAFAIVTLIPIYSTVEHGVHTIEDMTMGNIKQGGDRLWASLVAFYLFNIVFLVLLYKEYEYFVDLRQQFLKDGDPEFNPQISYSVLVENVPAAYRSSEKLKELFSKLFPGEIKCARILMNVEPLIKVVTERLGYVATLENAEASFEASDKAKVSEIKVKDNKPTLCGGVKEEAIPFCESKIKELTKLLKKLKAQANSYDVIDPEEGEGAGGDDDGDDEGGGVVGAVKAGYNKAKGDDKDKEEEEDEFSADSVAPTGVVTFKSRRAQAAAMQLLFLDSNYPDMFTLPAPAPNNLIWANVNVPNDMIMKKSIFTSALLYTGIIFWAVIVAFIAGVSKLSNLEHVFPFLKSLDPTSYALLEGQVPVIVLAVFIAILPMIFTAISMYVEKRKTIVALENEVTKW